MPSLAACLAGCPSAGILCTGCCPAQAAAWHSATPPLHHSTTTPEQVLRLLLLLPYPLQADVIIDETYAADPTTYAGEAALKEWGLTTEDLAELPAAAASRVSSGPCAAVALLLVLSGPNTSPPCPALPLPLPCTALHNPPLRQEGYTRVALLPVLNHLLPTMPFAPCPPAPLPRSSARTAW